MDSRLRRCLGGFRENCIFIYAARNSVAEKLFILFIHARYALGVHGGVIYERNRCGSWNTC